MWLGLFCYGSLGTFTYRYAGTDARISFDFPTDVISMCCKESCAAVAVAGGSEVQAGKLQAVAATAVSAGQFDLQGRKAHTAGIAHKMRWRDELISVNGRPVFITGMEIEDDELDVTYLTDNTVHDMVNMCVMFGVKVAAA